MCKSWDGVIYAYRCKECIKKNKVIEDTKAICLSLIACQDELKSELPEIVYRVAEAAKAVITKVEGK